MPLQWRAGAQIDGRWWLDEYLTGGRNHVWRCHDDAGTAAVLKATATDAAAGLRNEANGLRRAQCAQLPALLGEGADDDWVWLVVADVGGETLQDRWGGEPDVPLAEVLAVAADVARALRVLDSKGAIHRDVKPANIVVRRTVPTLEVVLIDLDIMVERGSRPDITATHDAGTDQYKPPEANAAGRRISGAWDVWSLGRTLSLALLGGTLAPWPATTTQQLAVCRLRDTPQHRGIVQLVDRMLAYDPADRPTADTILRTLTDPGFRPPRSPRWPLAAAAAIGLVVTTAGAALIGRPEPGPLPEPAPEVPVHEAPAEPPAPARTTTSEPPAPTSRSELPERPRSAPREATRDEGAPPTTTVAEPPAAAAPAPAPTGPAPAMIVVSGATSLVVHDAANHELPVDVARGANVASGTWRYRATLSADGGEVAEGSMTVSPGEHWELRCSRRLLKCVAQAR